MPTTIQTEGTKRKMCIITLNVPENYVDIIDKYLCSFNYGFYTSRSEFIRTAINNQLEKDLGIMDYIANKVEKYENQDTQTIRIPYENGESKLYKIVRRLE